MASKMGTWNPVGVFIGLMLFFFGLAIIGILPTVGAVLLLLSICLFYLSHSKKSTAKPSRIQFPNPPPSPPSSYELKKMKAAEMRNNPTPAEQRMRQILS